ncbi:uncharacterized protein BROUX77_000906 [Berkeleyomyces rouxiae]|uniref:uncharacterized protein n=1 Tax=Berkeleyomyces rouxiae TaxID=2035830 RepID=UPI003B788630
MDSAFVDWQTTNNIKLVDPTLDALYNYDAAVARKEIDGRPWKNKPQYFKNVRVSAVAMIKMVMHAQSGGDLEVMGCMQGYVSGDTFIVTDAFPLPVEGTETRVNAQDEANEYLVQYLKACRENGREENVVGWYHSHPGYGCWLSGIDVETQKLQQQFNDPFLAIVIDPHRTLSSGKVDIGAFRTFPDTPETNKGGLAAAATVSSSRNQGQDNATAAGAEAGGEAGGDKMDSTGDIPAHKVADFGAHANRYYSLDVSHYKSTLDTNLLSLLWSKYWVQTLAAPANPSSVAFTAQSMRELSAKMGETSAAVRKSYTHLMPANFSNVADRSMQTTAQASRDLAAMQKASVTAFSIKKNLFNGLGLNKSSS